MSTVTTPSVLLTVQDVAAELALDPVEVQRLIAAKRSLQATRVGADGEYRLTRTALEAYVQKGAPEAKLAGFKPGNEDGWFSEDFHSLADGFSSAVIDAAQEQVPAEASIRTKFEADKFSSSIQFQVANRGAVAALMSQEVPVSVFAPPDVKQTSGRLLFWSDAYAVDMLRRIARQIMRDRDLMAAPFGLLYKSPEDFTAIVDAAFAQAAQRKIVFSKNYTFPGAAFGMAEPVSRRADFMYSLASGPFAPSGKSRLVSLAF